LNWSARRGSNGSAVHPELAGIRVENGGQLSRSEMLLKGVLAGAALCGIASVGPFVRSALATAKSDEIDSLNFGLTLAYLETDFYVEAHENRLGDAKDEFLIGLIADHEENHWEALVPLIRRMGGRPVAKPKFDFRYANVEEFFKMAQAIQDAAVGAYNGIASSLEDAEALALIGSMVQGEARFAAAVRLRNGEEPAPNAFDPLLSEAQVRPVIDPLIQ
jgi:hypothetical protein